MKRQIEQFISRTWSVPPSQLRLDVQPLGRGLESAVALATIEPNRSYSRLPTQLVVKALRREHGREADVYQALWRHLKHPPTARMHGVDLVDDTTYLYLEYVPAVCPWPWSNTEMAADVCRELARFHDARAMPGLSFTWRYEDYLKDSAAQTLALAKAARDNSGKSYWRRLGDLKRTVSALTSMRSRLLATETTMIHGDVHPGNVIMRGVAAEPRVTLIDWGRARIGSPLEDVASWLHSLGCWEPQARRRHDTLLRAYLESRHEPRMLTGELRQRYWMASASNGLAGAIRYHLAMLGNQESTEAVRDGSGRALMAWERVIRRASALLSTTPNR